MKLIKTVADIDPNFFVYAQSASGTSHRRGSKKFDEILNRIYKANPKCILHDFGGDDIGFDNYDLWIALMHRVADTHNAVCNVRLCDGVPTRLEYIYYYNGDTHQLVLLNPPYMWPEAIAAARD